MRAYLLTAALILAVGGGACGGGDSGDDDAADAAPSIDGGAGTDAHTGRGNVGDFGDPDNGPCVVDDDCANPDSDCKPIGRLVGSPKQCVPRCSTRDDCPFDYICYLSDSPLLGIDQLKGHCWWSLCGPVFENGETSGGCQVGGDMPGQPVDEVYPGWCSPLIDGAYGICYESGAVPPGGACDFSDRTHAGDNCDATSLCIGNPSQPTQPGVCHQWCDPRPILTGGATGCTLPGEQCLDRSNVATYSDGSIEQRTVAWCAGVTACATIGANSCPDAAAGDAQGCAATNPLRPTGLCTPGASGTLAEGASCPDMPSGDAEECTPGTICFDQSGTSKCTTICDLDPLPDVLCPGGLTCQSFVWNDGFDDTPGTADDNFTFGWGACQP